MISRGGVDLGRREAGLPCLPGRLWGQDRPPASTWYELAPVEGVKSLPRPDDPAPCSARASPHRGARRPPTARRTPRAPTAPRPAPRKRSPASPPGRRLPGRRPAAVPPAVGSIAAGGVAGRERRLGGV